MVGSKVPAEVLELVALAESPDFNAYFDAKGAMVSAQFEALALPPPSHGAYGVLVEPPIPVPPLTPFVVQPVPPIWRRAINKLDRIVARLR